MFAVSIVRSIKRNLRMTPIEIREKGYQALMTALGPVDMARFLQQVGWGTGDYTKERQQWLGSVSRESLYQDIQRIRSRKEEAKGAGYDT